MDLKEKILITLKSLKSKGFSRADIEAELNYSENYIDQILSKGGNEKALKNLIALDKRSIAKNNTNLLNDDAADYKPGSGKFEKIIFTDVPIEKLVSDLMESVISLEAKVSVLEQLSDLSVSHQTGNSVPVVSAERKKAVAMDAERLLDERKKRYGKA